MIAKQPFNREEHIFRSPELENLLKDAIRFFNGTPIYELPLPESFIGSGIYAIYYTGSFELYAPLTAVNRIRYDLPLYVGKAIPSGSRRGRGGKEGSSLCKRLGEHAKSIQDALIAPIESAIIKQYNPLWNACVDGFGNHDPGGGRYDQARSQWDVIHPGRKWAEKLKGVKGENDPNVILKNIQDYAEILKARGSDV
jgi:hypothetical protein